MEGAVRASSEAKRPTRKVAEDVIKGLSETKIVPKNSASAGESKTLHQGVMEIETVADCGESGGNVQPLSAENTMILGRGEAAFGERREDCYTHI